MPSKFKSERNAANRRWYAKYKERLKEEFKENYRKTVSTPQGHVELLIKLAISRAHRNILKTTPNLHTLIIAPKHCLYCQEEIDYSIGKGTGPGARTKSPSVDQRIPSHGYTIENTQIICRGCNIKKQTLTEEEFLKRNNLKRKEVL